MIIFIFFTYIKAWIREKRKIYEGANAMGVIVHIPYKKRKKKEVPRLIATKMKEETAQKIKSK